MIVYGRRTYELKPRSFLAALRRRLDSLPADPDRDAIVDLFVDAGEAYAAVADRLQPLRDDDCAQLRPWSAVMQSVADALCGHWHGDHMQIATAIANGSHAAARAEDLATDGEINAKTAEGFAYYALYPEQYLLAAQRFFERRAPQTVTCVGLRGIGAPLAHLVAAEGKRRAIVCDVIAVRPRGHPFDRRLVLSGRLRERLCRPSAHIAIVDEGPGLSGSSFAAAVDALSSLRVTPERITLFPSWTPPLSALRSPRGIRAFERHDSFVAAFEEIATADGWTEMSAGRWRHVVIGDDERRWPATHPQHERRKYRSPDGTLTKRFVGLGRYGASAFARAVALAGRGFTAPPVALESGFLTQLWSERHPMPSAENVPERAIDAMASYIAYLRREHTTGRTARTSDLLEMMDCNIGEGIASAPGEALGGLFTSARSLHEPEVAIDARMLPHEWLYGNGGYTKVDALDHHADDFFPGPRDAAWDVAGAIVEFQLDTARADRLVHRYRAESRDRSIAERLPFYRAAYLAYRLGYSTLAAESLTGTDEARRFTRLKERYRRSLEALVRVRPRARRR